MQGMSVVSVLRIPAFISILTNFLLHTSYLALSTSGRCSLNGIPTGIFIPCTGFTLSLEKLRNRLYPLLNRLHNGSPL